MSQDNVCPKDEAYGAFSYHITTEQPERRIQVFLDQAPAHSSLPCETLLYLELYVMDLDHLGPAIC